MNANAAKCSENIAIQKTRYLRKRDGQLSQTEVSHIVYGNAEDPRNALIEIFNKTVSPWAWAKIVRTAVDQAIAGDAAARQWVSRLLLPEGRISKGRAAAGALQILAHATKDLKVTFRKSNQEVELTAPSESAAPRQGDEAPLGPPSEQPTV